MSEATQLGVEEDLLDASVAYVERERRKQRLRALEDQARLTVQVTLDDAGLRTLRGREHERRHPRCALQGPPKVLKATDATPVGAAVGDQRGVFG